MSDQPISKLETTQSSYVPVITLAIVIALWYAGALGVTLLELLTR
jgi:hypothetical protein